jgi:hypothetical protein
MMTKLSGSALKMLSILRSHSFTIPQVLRYSTQVQPDVDVETTQTPTEKGLLIGM